MTADDTPAINAVASNTGVAAPSVQLTAVEYAAAAGITAPPTVSQLRSVAAALAESLPAGQEPKQPTKRCDGTAVTVDLDQLRKRCDPVGNPPWPGCKPYTAADVSERAAGQTLSRQFDPDTEYHLRRVAAFVDPAASAAVRQPPQLDAASPHWPVQDGNHRLAAAMVRGDPTMRFELGGMNCLLRSRPDEYKVDLSVHDCIVDTPTSKPMQRVAGRASHVQVPAPKVTPRAPEPLSKAAEAAHRAFPAAAQAVDRPGLEMRPAKPRRSPAPDKVLKPRRSR